MHILHSCRSFLPSFFCSLSQEILKFLLNTKCYNIVVDTKMNVTQCIARGSHTMVEEMPVQTVKVEVREVCAGIVEGDIGEGVGQMR